MPLQTSDATPSLGCDTLVALPPATRDGCTLFAKNSDRPPDECQPLVQFAAEKHPPGAKVRCQYLTIPQVRHTHRFVAAQPYWLWGAEHGVNEWQVAIGNEAVFTRDPVPETGLLGMDLVRLGLERADSARRGVEVITELLETYGQGGPALPGTNVGYHNSYLLADPTEAWILETSGKRWAAKQVRDFGSISNQLTLDEDWESGSPDLESYAVEQGWWAADEGRLRFAAAYRDEAVPGSLSEGRLARSRALLERDAGRLTEQALISFLRDHGEGTGPVPEEPGPERASVFTLCCHMEPFSATTAGIVARLRTSTDGRPDLWACLGSPCTGIFLPVYLDQELPPELARGGAQSDRRSPWWRLKTLRDETLSGPREGLLRLQASWGDLERQLFDETERLAAELSALPKGGLELEGGRLKADLTVRAVEEMLRHLDDLGF